MGQTEVNAYPVFYPVTNLPPEIARGDVKPGITYQTISPTDEAIERLKAIFDNVGKTKSYGGIKPDLDYKLHEERNHPFLRPLTYKEIYARAYDKNKEVKQTLSLYENNPIATPKTSKYFPIILIAIALFLFAKGG